MITGTDLLPLARSLPGNHSDISHLKRIEHCQKEGILICVHRGGKIVAYAELYQMSKCPKKYPVYPFPLKDRKGKYIYCYAVSVDESYRKQGILKEMRGLARLLFKRCKYLCYHRHDAKNKLQIERLQLCA